MVDDIEITTKPAVLLDLDGTIFDSYTGIKQSFLFALQKNEIPIPDKDLIAGIAGPPMKNTLAQLNLTTTQINKINADYVKHYTEIGWKNSKLFPNTVKLLKALKSSGKLISSATSKNVILARKMLNHYDLAKYFDFIAGGEPNLGPADKITVITKALDGLNCEPKDVVMVGDRIFDIMGAKHFGIPTIFVNWGYAPDSSEGTAARKVVNDMHELIEVLTNVSNPK